MKCLHIVLDRGESLKLFTTDQSYIEVMALIGGGLVLEEEVGCGSGGDGCFSFVLRAKPPVDRGQLDNP